MYGAFSRDEEVIVLKSKSCGVNQVSQFCIQIRTFTLDQL